MSINRMRRCDFLKEFDGKINGIEFEERTEFYKMSNGVGISLDQVSQKIKLFNTKGKDLDNMDEYEILTMLTHEPYIAPDSFSDKKNLDDYERELRKVKRRGLLLRIINFSVICIALVAVYLLCKYIWRF